MENNAAADEGVSLSATPASEENAEEKKVEAVKKDLADDAIGEEDEEELIEDETQAMLDNKTAVAGASLEAKAIITSTASSGISNHEQFTEHRVNAQVSQPPRQQPQQPSIQGSLLQHQPQVEETSDHQYFYQQMQVGPSIPTTRKQQQIPAFGHPLANVLPPQQTQSRQRRQPPPPPSSLRTLNEKEVMQQTSVTAVTHQDINGVSTVAMKDLDVQMTAMSGYETYV